MKLRVAWRNFVHYVRTDLKEIAFPSSLPDPPSSKPKPPKLTFKEHLQIWKIGTWDYIRSWKTGTVDDPDENSTDNDNSKESKKESEDPSIVEELAMAVRAGSNNLRPALQKVYMTRAIVYRDALKSFIQGYQEGLAEAVRDAAALKNHMGGPEEFPRGGDPDHRPDVTPPVIETRKK